MRPELTAVTEDSDQVCDVYDYSEVVEPKEENVEIESTDDTNELWG